MQHYSYIIAHRGAGRLAPENTLAAMRLAAHHRLSMVEFDVGLSRDEIPVVIHDRDIRRTSNGKGNVDELTLAELAQFDFGGWHGPEFAGEPLATLYSIAAFTLAKNIRSNIEIKPQPGRETLTGQVVARVAAKLWRQAASPPLLSSFSEASLRSARDAAPQLPRALLLDQPLPTDWHERAAGLGCIGLHLPQEHVDRDTIVALHGKGYKIAAWTVNDVQRAHQLLQWGCDALFTDAIDTLPAALQTI